jgi:SAM-dependent methyltransferase
MPDEPPRTPEEGAALARLYDLDLDEEPGDLDLYLALARRADGPVLELAAGTGRLAIPLAEAGFDVTGVDIDPAMLDRARAAAETSSSAGRLDLVEGDLLYVRLPAAGSFALAILALNSLFLLETREAQRDALRTMATHLRPGGLAVVDVWIPDADDLARFDGRISLEHGRRDPQTGGIVTKAASARHDASSGVVTLTTIYEEGAPGEPVRRWLRVDRLRLVGADELRAFAEDAGLEIEQVAGGYDLEPIGPGSERAVLVARRP